MVEEDGFRFALNYTPHLKANHRSTTLVKASGKHVTAREKNLFYRC